MTFFFFPFPSKIETPIRRAAVEKRSSRASVLEGNIRTLPTALFFDDTVRDRSIVCIMTIYVATKDHDHPLGHLGGAAGDEREPNLGKGTQDLLFLVKRAPLLIGIKFFDNERASDCDSVTRNTGRPMLEAARRYGTRG